MSTEELKAALHLHIDATTDPEMLELVKQLLTGQASLRAPGQLTKEEIAELHRRREEIRSGNFVTHEDVMSRARKWLKS